MGTHINKKQLEALLKKKRLQPPSQSFFSTKKGRSSHSIHGNKYERERIRIENQSWQEVVFEKLIIPLASRCGYQPDLLCLNPGKLPEFVEVKGSHIEDDAAVKMRVSARLIYPIKLKIAKKDKGSWKCKYYEESPLLGEEPYWANDDSWIIGTRYVKYKDKTFHRKLKTKRTSINEISGEITLWVEEQELLNEEKRFKKKINKEINTNSTKLKQEWETFLDATLIRIKLLK